MNKKSRQVITYTILFTTFLILCTLLVLYLLNKNTFLNTTKNNDKKPDYHFAVIAPSVYDAFWQDVKKGTFKAASDFNVAVEFNSPRFTNIEEELDYLNIAIASGVDGIATHVPDESKFTAVINAAFKKSIPVVTIESDAKNSKRVAYIGNNNYQVGVEGGKMVAAATSNSAKVAIILNSSNPDSLDVSQNLRISGFKDAVKDLKGKVEIAKIRTSGMGIFSAGEIASDLITNNPEINAIFCTNSRDTLGVAQVLVDLNKVGKIKVVGYGSYSEVIRYIDIGVIYGSIVSNPVVMGYDCIKSLVEIKKMKNTSVYVDTGVHSVTKENVDLFVKSESN